MKLKNSKKIVKILFFSCLFSRVTVKEQLKFDHEHWKVLRVCTSNVKHSARSSDRKLIRHISKHALVNTDHAHLTLKGYEGENRISEGQVVTTGTIHPIRVD